MALTIRDWRDGEKIPATGGCVVVVNHVSHLDPMTFGLFLYNHGRLVRYLTKDALFRTPVLKYIVKDAKQIPVTRMSEGAAHAPSTPRSRRSSRASASGSTPRARSPRTPTVGRCAARPARRGSPSPPGCPVIPIGQWGVQDMLPAYAARPHLFPRKTTRYKVGDPVDLSDLMDKPVTSEVLHEATDRIMAAVTALVEELRGEKAPAVRFDPKTSGVTEIGNPNKKKRKT